MHVHTRSNTISISPYQPTQPDPKPAFLAQAVTACVVCMGTALPYDVIIIRNSPLLPEPLPAHSRTLTLTLARARRPCHATRSHDKTKPDQRGPGRCRLPVSGAGPCQPVGVRLTEGGRDQPARKESEHNTTQDSTAPHSALHRSTRLSRHGAMTWAGVQLYKLGNEVVAASPGSWQGPRQHPPRQSLPMGSVMGGSMHMHSAPLRLVCT